MASLNGHRLTLPAFPERQVVGGGGAPVSPGAEQGGAAFSSLPSWPEVNSGLGHLAMLVRTLQQLIQNLTGEAPKIHFVIEGSGSQVIDHTSTYHNLFFKEGSSTTSIDEALGYMGKAVKSLCRALRCQSKNEIRTKNLHLAEGDNHQWGEHMYKLIETITGLIFFVDNRRRFTLHEENVNEVLEKREFFKLRFLFTMTPTDTRKERYILLNTFC